MEIDPAIAVAAYVRHLIDVWHDGPEKLSFHAIGRDYLGCSRQHVNNMQKSRGGAGADVEIALAHKLFKDSVDALRKEAIRWFGSPDAERYRPTESRLQEPGDDPSFRAWLARYEVQPHFRASTVDVVRAYVRGLPRPPSPRELDRMATATDESREIGDLIAARDVPAAATTPLAGTDAPEGPPSTPSGLHRTSVPMDQESSVSVASTARPKPGKRAR